MNDRRHPSGFTMMELTLSIAIVSIIGVCVAGVAVAISQAHQAAETYYANVQQTRAALQKMSQDLRDAKLVLSYGPGTLTLWMADTTDRDQFARLGHVRQRAAIGPDVGDRLQVRAPGDERV